MRIQKGAGGVSSKPKSPESVPKAIISLEYPNRGLNNEELAELLSEYTPSQRCNIVSLNVADNNLTLLPELPVGLQVLYCETNQLTVLPPLPNGLKGLRCSRNNLTVLPPLPDTLTGLNCHTNNLTVLPPLPHGLKGLICYTNNLTILPPLPDGLIELYCNDNELRVLPPLPYTLKSLDAVGNIFDEPFASFIDIYYENNNINLLITSVNNYYETKHRGINLGAFERTLGAYETAARLEAERARREARNFDPTSIEDRFKNIPVLPNGPTSVIAELLTGKTGTLQQQRIKLKENASRIPGAPGIARRTRKSKARKSRKSKARKSRK